MEELWLVSGIGTQQHFLHYDFSITNKEHDYRAIVNESLLSSQTKYLLQAVAVRTWQ